MGGATFLDLDALVAARAAVLPIPYEANVSWHGGTAGGPAAVIEASCEVELYDRRTGREPALIYGIETLPALDDLPVDDPETALARIAEAVEQRTRAGQLVAAIGGEHTITAGIVRGLLAAEDGPITVVQLDAHCDLRDSYDGTRFSHACVARRLLEDDRVEQVLQVGVRSLCTEEAELIAASPDRIRTWFAEDVHAGGWEGELRERLRGRRVHLTLDVDGLDPGIIPATGTPEPGGLTWAQALRLVAVTCESAERIAGIDLVELAPRPGLHAADFAAAKLLYITITDAIDRRDHASRS